MKYNATSPSSSLIFFDGKNPGSTTWTKLETSYSSIVILRGETLLIDPGSIPKYVGLS